MARKVSFKKYLIAFVLTIIIFFGGIIIGGFLENAQLQDTKEITLNEKVNLQSLQLQQKYIGSGIADCKTLNQVLQVNIGELSKKMDVVLEYEKSSIFNSEKFNLQLRDYFLTEIQFLLTAQEIDKQCPRDTIKVIYFYDENALDTQGDILEYLKKLFGDRLLIFSFNSAFKEEPMIQILMSAYKIESFPSVVLEDQVFHGHASVEELMKTICNEFKGLESDVPKECRIFN